MLLLVLQLLLLLGIFSCGGRRRLIADAVVVQNGFVKLGLVRLISLLPRSHHIVDWRGSPAYLQ